MYVRRRGTSAGVEDFLVRYGLVAVFFGAALEGDLSIIMAGVFAHLGYFGIVRAIEVACLGAIAGDCGWYWVGRSQSGALRRTRLYRRGAPAIERLVARVGEWEIVLARFVYGTRIASMFFWGVRHLAFVRFLALDALGCVLSVTLLVGVGYALTGSAAVIIGRVRRAERWLAILLAASVGVVLLIRAVSRRATAPRGTVAD